MMITQVEFLMQLLNAIECLADPASLIHFTHIDKAMDALLIVRRICCG